MMKRISILFAALFFALILTVGQASAYTVTIDGLDSVDTVHGFSLWFDVSADFSYSNLSLGDAIPAAISTGWIADNPQVVDSPDNIFKYGAGDMDYSFMASPNPLLNGTLFSFDYTGTILGFRLVQFADITAGNLYAEDNSGAIKLLSFDANGAAFGTSQVPVPGAVWLLGSGLFGLVAIRRRRV